MGFCTPEEYRRFLHQAPIVERLLVEDGILLRKYWFCVSDAEQEARFASRLDDPMRRWKLSPMDLESITRWEDYSRAKDEMLVHTDIAEAPWYVVEADDKRRARLNMIAPPAVDPALQRGASAGRSRCRTAPKSQRLRAPAARAERLRPRPRRDPAHQAPKYARTPEPPTNPS